LNAVKASEVFVQDCADDRRHTTAEV
jgi:hypothetical protein